MSQRVSSQQNSHNNGNELYPQAINTSAVQQIDPRLSQQQPQTMRQVCNKPIRVSIQVPQTPRFVISLNKEMFTNLKQFIAYLCAETGLQTSLQTAETASSTASISTEQQQQQQHQQQHKTYLLMLDDAILLNLDSIQENDRLSLIPAEALQSFVQAKDEERRQESIERQNLRSQSKDASMTRSSSANCSGGGVQSSSNQPQLGNQSAHFQPTNITNVMQTLQVQNQMQGQVSDGTMIKQSPQSLQQQQTSTNSGANGVSGGQQQAVKQLPNMPQQVAQMHQQQQQQMNTGSQQAQVGQPQQQTPLLGSILQPQMPPHTSAYAREQQAQCGYPAPAPMPLPIAANGVPQFKNSWHMSLFKLVSSSSHKEVTQQVKYAALQNGFRAIAELKEPFKARDGSQKLFYCCHQKPNKCLFRLQFLRRSIKEDFRYYKGRDLHNHDFMEPSELLKDHFSQKMQNMNDTEDQQPQNVGGGGGQAIMPPQSMRPSSNTASATNAFYSGQQQQQLQQQPARFYQNGGNVGGQASQPIQQNQQHKQSSADQGLYASLQQHFNQLAVPPHLQQQQQNHHQVVHGHPSQQQPHGLSQLAGQTQQQHQFKLSPSQQSTTNYPASITMAPNNNSLPQKSPSSIQYVKSRNQYDQMSNPLQKLDGLKSKLDTEQSVAMVHDGLGMAVRHPPLINHIQSVEHQLMVSQGVKNEPTLQVQAAHPHQIQAIQLHQQMQQRDAEETAADDDEIIRDDEEDEYGTVGNGELDICLTNTTGAAASTSAFEINATNTGGPHQLQQPQNQQTQPQRQSVVLNQPINISATDSQNCQQRQSVQQTPSGKDQFVVNNAVNPHQLVTTANIMPL